MHYVVLAALTLESLIAFRFPGVVAVDAGQVNDAFGQIERISNWPAQTLIIGLFAALIFICFLAVKTTRKDMTESKESMDRERQQYNQELHAIHKEARDDRREMIKVLERNNILFSQIERRLDVHDRPTHR